MSRPIPILIALAVGFGVGFLVGDMRARSRAAVVVTQAETSARDAAQLRTERDALVAELAESRRTAADLRTETDAVRRDLEARLARLEQLIAALVGTRHPGDDVPTPTRSPEDKEVLEDD